MLGFSRESRTKEFRVTNTNERESKAAAERNARDRMIARQKLIDRIIFNNELQLKNESARGGAEIELECAKRDVARTGAGAEAQVELKRTMDRLQKLHDEHQRLLAERKWLDESLLEFDNGPSSDEHQRSGHA
jgi:hypothetical protein